MTLFGHGQNRAIVSDKATSDTWDADAAASVDATSFDERLLLLGMNSATGWNQLSTGSSGLSYEFAWRTGPQASEGFFGLSMPFQPLVGAGTATSVLATACDARPATVDLSSISGPAPTVVQRNAGSIFAPGINFASTVGIGGSTALRADLLRSTFGVDGTGVKIGVLSDSFNAQGGYATDVANGDLPAGVTVLAEGPSGSSDEGRAMLELVHQIAPGAQLYFRTSDNGEGDAASGIEQLRAAGCNIIIDDFTYFDEPFFQPDQISQAIDNAVNTGAIYFTSAGNDASNAYQSNWRSTNGDTQFNFNAASGPAVTTQTVNITILPGQDIVFDLQWNQPFSSPQTSFDLVATDQFGDTFSSQAEGGVNFNGQALSLMALQNPFSFAVSLALSVSIDKLSGPDPGLIKYMVLGDGQSVSISGANSGTVLGHHLDTNAITIGAANASTLQMEPFSSSGKVNLASVDGVHTSLTGSLSNFFGTSAAVATAGAVAALLEQAAPGDSTAQIRAALETSATDISTVGVDNLSGHGLINGLAAAQVVAAPHLYLANDAGSALYPGTGTNTVRGGAGNDTIFVSKPSSNAIDGSGGINTLDYSLAPDAVTVNFAMGTTASSFGADTFVNVENVNGSAFDDTFIGSAGSHTINGGNGINTLDYSAAAAAVTVNLAFNNGGIAGSATNGFGGTDTLMNIERVKTGSGNDILSIGLGSYTLDGGGGTNTLDWSHSGFGGLTVDLSAGTMTAGNWLTRFANIQAFSGSLQDTFVGAAGNHTISDGFGGTLDYSRALSAVDVNLATGIASNGFGGTDQISGINTVKGSRFGGSLTGGANPDTFVIEGGNNIVDGGGNLNTLDYSDSTAVTVNLAASTVQNGFGGIDVFTNIQTIRGSAGNDRFIGFVSAPSAISYNLDGGSGVNTLDYSGEAAAVSINTAGIATSGAHPGTTFFRNMQVIDGSAFDDTFVAGSAGNHTLDGGGGTNTLTFSAASNVVVDFGAGTADYGSGQIDRFRNFQTFGGALGEATFIAGAGNHTIRGGDGINKLDFSTAPGAVTLSFNAGTAVNGFGGRDVFTNIQSVTGSAHDDTVIGGPGNHTIDGGGGVNTLDYSAASNAVNVNLATGVVTNGFGGSDQVSNIQIVKGGAGNDALIGGAGDEVFFGGAGSDAIQGGSGKNTAAYSGPRANYNLAITPSGLIVQDLVGTDGTDTLTNVQFLQFSDGTFSVANRAPNVTALNPSVHGATQQISATALFSVTSSDVYGISQYDLWDPIFGDGGFSINGVAQPARQETFVTSLAGLVWDTTGQSGSTVFGVRAFDGSLWSDWTTVTVTATDAPPAITALNPTVHGAQQIAATSLFSASDPDNDPITQYDLWDPLAGNGGFVDNGTAVAARQETFVTSLAGLVWDTTGQSGSTVFGVRAFDGSLWSDWTTVTVADIQSTPAVPAGAIAQNSMMQQFTQAMATFSPNDGSALATPLLAASDSPPMLAALPQRHALIPN